MFWVFTAASAIGYSFFKLGAISVWNSVLTLVIQILIIALLVAIGYRRQAFRHPLPDHH